MKLMIVGGTGFLGYYSAKVALEKGYQVASLSLDDVKLEGWYPKEIDVHYGDVFEMTEEQLVEQFKGFDEMIYSVGPDDRVTPPAPSYEFFHKRLVDHVVKVFKAAKKAGIKRAVVFNSYFATFDRLYPEKKLAVYHPYIRSRVEQAKALIELGEEGKFDVMVLELPYIFGSMPERMPIWKEVFIDRFFKGKTVFFPKGGTTMIHVKHIGEAAIGALEHGKNGGRYPIGDLNVSYNFMLEAMMEGLQCKKKIVNVNKKLCAFGANMIAKKDAKEGKQAGLNMKHLMLDIMGDNLYIPEEEIVKTSTEFGYGRGEVKEGIIEAMHRCYPNGYDKQ